MKYFIIIFTLIFLSSCASGVQKMRKLNSGMTPAEVDRIMGERDGFSSVEKDNNIYTLYKYTNQFCNAHVSLAEKCDFFIIFKNNKVIETSVKNVRVNNPNMQFIYLFQP